MSHLDTLALERLDGPGATWIHAPTGDTNLIESVAREYGFAREDIHACQPVVERPRLLIRPGYAFLVMHFPARTLGTGHIETAELDVFVTPNVLITSVTGHLAPLDVLRERLWHDGRLRAVTLVSPFDALGTLLEHCLIEMFPLLASLHQAVTTVDETLLAGRGSEIVTHMLQVRQQVIQVRRIAMEQRVVLHRFHELSRRFGGTGDSERANHLMRHADEIWQSLESAREAIDALWDANNAMISYRTSSVMRTLTIFSVIIFPLTLVATIFSMNTPLMPFVDDRYGFWEIIGLLAGMAVSILCYFRYKKWL